LIMAILRTLFLCGVVAAGALYAQAQGGAASEPKFLRLNIVATDSRGEPVADLKSEDFRITDDGKPQRIALFHSSTSGMPAPQGGGHFNRAAVPHSTAILFDFLNEDLKELQDVSRKMGQSLKQLESGDSLYIYILQMDGKLYPVHGIPGGPAEAAEKNWIKDVDGLLSKAVKKLAGTKPAGIQGEETTKRTYVGLESMAKLMAALPGRKDILWITDQVPFTIAPQPPCKSDWIDCGLYVPHLSVTLDLAGAVVSPYSYSSLLGPDKNRDLEDMAGLTGGRTYFSEDMRTVTTQLAGSGSGIYSLVYEPPHENWDNKFHKIKVTCERRGVKVQARQRYYGLPDSRNMVARQQAALVAAYQSPSDVPDIGLRAVLSPGADPQKSVKVDLRIDPADLLLQEQAGTWNGQITVLFSARTAAGPKTDPTLNNLALHMTKEQLETAAKDGIPISHEYPIDNTIQNIRMIILDQATGYTGSLTIPYAAK
jgi:VWFA-related protein